MRGMGNAFGATGSPLRKTAHVVAVCVNQEWPGAVLLVRGPAERSAKPNQDPANHFAAGPEGHKALSI